MDTGTSPTDSGDTGLPVDTGPLDTGDPWFDTGLPLDSGEPVDTGLPVDTGPIDTGDPWVDTGTSPVDTGTGDSGTWTDPGDSAVDTAVSWPDSGDTGDSGTIVIPGGGSDTADSADTGAPWDTARPDTGDTAADTGASDTSVVDTASTGGSGGGFNGGDTGGGKETGSPYDSDTSVYVPDPCDTADTATDCGDVIRFVALGDAGTGDRRQIDVAGAMEAICVLDGCDFALYLGDNIYGSGPSDVTDVQWNTKFEIPYAGLGFMFYAVLGNHDYGGYYDTATAAVEVAYTAYSTKWYMPARYYTETLGDLTVLGLDTQAMQLGHGADQEAWIPGAEAGISTTWTIAIGHHPYISNGPHGNAGEFDGSPGEGQPMKDFFDAYVCGIADVYLAGHDHALQWLEPPSGCATEMLVAGGGGAGTYPIVGSNAAYFEDSNNGFLWVEINGNQFTGVFYDETGAELYRRVFTK